MCCMLMFLCYRIIKSLYHLFCLSLERNVKSLLYSTSSIFSVFRTSDLVTKRDCAGLPPQHLYYAPPEGHPAPSPSAGPKYHHETNGGGGGQDTFSDFVTLVCQEGGVPPGPSRSPKVNIFLLPGLFSPYHFRARGHFITSNFPGRFRRGATTRRRCTRRRPPCPGP